MNEKTQVPVSIADTWQIHTNQTTSLRRKEKLMQTTRAELNELKKEVHEVGVKVAEMERQLTLMRKQLITMEDFIQVENARLQAMNK